MTCCRKDTSDTTNDTTEIALPEEIIDPNEPTLTFSQSLLGTCFRFITVRMSSAGVTLIFFANQPLPYLAMLDMMMPSITGSMADLSYLLSSNRHPLEAIKEYGNGSWKKGLIKSTSRIIEIGANAGAGFGVGYYIVTQSPLWRVSDESFAMFLYTLFNNRFSRATLLMLLSGLSTAITNSLFEKCIPSKKSSVANKEKTMFGQKAWKVGVARIATVSCTMYLTRLVIGTISNEQVYKNPHLSLMVLGLDQGIQAIDYLLNTPQPFQQLVPKEKWIKQDQENQVEVATTREIAKATGWYFGRSAVFIATGIILIEIMNSCGNFDLPEQETVLSWLLAMAVAIVAEQFMEHFSTVKNNLSHAATTIWRKCGKSQEYNDLDDVPKIEPVIAPRLA